MASIIIKFLWKTKMDREGQLRWYMDPYKKMPKRLNYEQEKGEEKDND